MSENSESKPVKKAAAKKAPAAKKAKAVTPETPKDAAPVTSTPDPTKAAEPVSATDPTAGDLEAKKASNPNIPHQKLYISEEDVAEANARILEFAEKLEKDGERAFFEVHYPNDNSDLSDEEFALKDAATFDAVEVIEGKIYTLPPYSELEADNGEEGIDEKVEES